MEIRNTTMDDLDEVMGIYAGARQFMRDNGNMTQWINGYPSRELIQKDIECGNCYVCMDSSHIAGVFAFIQGTDPTYIKIYEGSWLNDEPYGVVHRIAVAIHEKGVASFCLEWCLGKCGNLKIDTHRDNIVMQKMLIKNGFKECGIIYLEDGAERIAFQKNAGQDACPPAPSSPEIDKHHRFDEEVFTYRVSKDKKVFISWYGKQVMILKGKDSEKFLARIANAEGIDAQLIMAKVTGNFKHGNEKRNKK